MSEKIAPISKQSGLHQYSSAYYDDNDIYVRFSLAEDYPRKIEAELLPLVTYKDVLDFGCGNGKYLQQLAPVAKSIIGVDLSEDQVAKAKAMVLRNNVSIYQCMLHSVPLSDDSVDIVISCWVFGTILDMEERVKTLDEVWRVLKPGGTMYLVENDLGGKFEEIRGRVNDPLERTKKYNDWIVRIGGFSVYSRLSTYFQFKSKQEAETVIRSIWGNHSGNRVRSKRIEHKVVIYSKTKY